MKRVSALAVLLFGLSIFSTHAQTVPLPYGMVQNQNNSRTCPALSGWVTATCVDATMHCDASLNVDDIPFTYGYSAPSGTYLGTVVAFSGGNGMTPATALGGEAPALQAYLAGGFEIVQVQWGSDWEESKNTFHGTYGNIQYAACRPAGLLEFVHNSTAANHANPVLFNPGGGMCAHGFSAGSAAVVYALAWYGAGWGSTGYLDNVELLSGPVLTRIDYGCQVPFAPSLDNICSGTSPVCNRAPNVNPWSAPEQFGSWANYPRDWSNITTCDNQMGTNTDQWNPVWQGMSILSSSITSQQLSYPSTSAKAWLCADVFGADEALNNSSSQGWLFYTQPGVSFMPGNWSVNAVTNCNGAEGVLGEHAIGPEGNTGLQDVTRDMLAQCKARPH
jgi:hypothetical protein